MEEKKEAEFEKEEQVAVGEEVPHNFLSVPFNIEDIDEIEQNYNLTNLQQRKEGESYLKSENLALFGSSQHGGMKKDAVTQKNILVEKLTKYENRRFFQHKQGVQEKIEKAKQLFFNKARELLKNNETIRQVYLEVIELEYQEENKDNLKAEINNILIELEDILEKTVFIVKTPDNISGYTSSFLNIFLKYDYYLYEHDEDFENYLTACLILSFIHETIHYVRRKLYTKFNKINFDTPRLETNNPQMHQLFLALKIEPAKQELFEEGEAGIRVEYLLFGEQIRSLFKSEISFFMDYLVNQPTISYVEFNNRQTAIISKQKYLRLKEGDRGDIGIGVCALASMRGLCY